MGSKDFLMVDVWSVKFENCGLRFLYPQTGLSPMGDRLLYAFHAGAHQEDLDRGESFLSDEAKLSDPINEDLPDSMFVTTTKLWRKRKETFGGSRIRSYLGRKRRQICVGRIFTTGLTPGDSRRYAPGDLGSRGDPLGNGANPKVQRSLKMIEFVSLV